MPRSRRTPTRSPRRCDPEFVLRVQGRIAARLAGTENPKLPTGAVELRADAIDVLSVAKTPPFVINDPDAEIDESVRLSYRYLDLRREPLQRRILTRGRLVQAIRETHHGAGFVEVETPLLIKSTPEGARDFIVPSRLQPGSIYALPQSPQQMKQLLMVAGMDRYFQIARCFRDEDLRGDRQPEFTQLDLEMSFVAEADVMAWVESMAIEVTRAVVPERPILQTPFPVLTYREAIDRFGSDKPDLRYGMELVDLADRGRGHRLPRVRRRARDGRPGDGPHRPGPGQHDPRPDRRADRARQALGRGRPRLAGTRGWRASGAPSSRRWGRSGRCHRALRRAPRDGDLVLIVADRDIHAQEVLGRLRVELAGRLGLADPNVLAYVWVHQFPMYQWDEEAHRWDATHNPFSGVMPEDLGLLVTDSGDPYAPARDRSGRPRPRAPVRPRAQRLGAGRRLDPVPHAGAAGEVVRAPGPLRRGHGRPSSGASWRPSSTARRRTAASRWASTAGRRCSPTRPTSGRSWRSPRPRPART